MRNTSLLIDFHNLFLNVVIYSRNATSDNKIFFSDLHGYFLLQVLSFIGGDFNCIDNVLDKLNCSIVFLALKTSRHACLISRFLMFGVNKIHAKFPLLGQIVIALKPLGLIAFYF